jgi:hypothetical protein
MYITSCCWRDDYWGSEQEVLKACCVSGYSLSKFLPSQTGCHFASRPVVTLCVVDWSLLPDLDVGYKPLSRTSTDTPDITLPLRILRQCKRTYTDAAPHSSWAPMGTLCRDSTLASCEPVAVTSDYVMCIHPLSKTLKCITPAKQIIV